MFLYESLSGLLGLVVLVWLGFHARKRLRPGDLLLVFFIWYAIVRFVLETFREGNWTFFGVPVAQIVSVLFIVAAGLTLLWRHRPGHPTDAPATHPEVATWGAIGSPVDDEDDDEYDDDEYDDDEYDDDDDDESEDEGDDGDDPGEDEGDGSVEPASDEPGRARLRDRPQPVVRRPTDRRLT